MNCNDLEKPVDWQQFPLALRKKLDGISVEILKCAFAAEEMRGDLFDAKLHERNVRWNNAMRMIVDLLREAGFARGERGESE